MESRTILTGTSYSPVAGPADRQQKIRLQLYYPVLYKARIATVQSFFYPFTSGHIKKHWEIIAKKETYCPGLNIF
ncbi:MAG: hypothetical protein CVU89_13990 [Firmicutes bacterium HGW-Firmicutes-14]|nr:MAG: hypothetical protein CVU89_13990 [Firmicutes bacterium HGW-Firmicutes-14]